MGLWDKKNKYEEQINTNMIKNSKIPILVLDKNWHYMFPPGRKTRKMIELEKKLNELLREQGRLTNQEKDCKGFKKECINEIMGLMSKVGDGNDDMSKSQKYIEEINNKLKYIEERLEKLPDEIKYTNNQLLNESVQMSYAEIKTNKERVNQLDMEIHELREKLKDRISEKTTKEEIIDRTYLFLHNLVGSDIINKLDKENIG